MKSSEEIEILIKKYYNGETSLEEEQQLQEFFLGEAVPGHLKTYREQFRHLKVSGEQAWPDFTEEKLFGKLEQQLGEKQEPKVVQMPRQRASAELWFYRIAAAVALVLVGYFAGRPGGGGSTDSEFQQLKELMMASLENNSASSRMQAVNYSFDVPESQVDDELLDVLIEVTLQDNNRNVRMKGVEALARFGEQPKVRTALIEALSTEKDPAVKIALIQSLVGLSEVGAIKNLEKVAGDQGNLQDVRDEARLGIFRLKEM